MKRLIATFSGHVQGVGFRYSTVHYARDYDVTGYVKNLPGGSVELVSEGEEKELKSFLKRICCGSLGGYIRNCDEVWTEALGVFTGFSIE